LVSLIWDKLDHTLNYFYLRELTLLSGKCSCKYSLKIKELKISNTINKGDYAPMKFKKSRRGEKVIQMVDGEFIEEDRVRVSTITKPWMSLSM